MPFFRYVPEFPLFAKYRITAFRKAKKIDNDDDEEEEEDEEEQYEDEDEDEEEDDEEEEEDDGEKWRPDSLPRYGSSYPTERPSFPRL